MDISDQLGELWRIEKALNRHTGVKTDAVRGEAKTAKSWSPGREDS